MTKWHGGFPTIPSPYKNLCAIHLQGFYSWPLSGVSWQTPPCPSSRVLSRGSLLWESCLPLFYRIWDFCLQTLAELKYWLFVKYKNMSSVLKSVPLKYSPTAKKKKKAWKTSPHQGIKVKISSNKTNGNHGPLIRGIEKDTASLWWCSCQIPRTWISSWENIRQNRLRAIL